MMIKAKNWSLTVLLAFSACAIGSVHGWAVATCVVLAGVVYGIEVLPGIGGSSRPRTPGVMGILAIVLLGYTALQLVPLPAAMVAAISPHSHEIRASLYSGLLGGKPPAWMPLTVDTTGTVMGLARTLSAVLTFLAVRHRVRSEGSRGVLSCVSVSGILVAVVSLVHRLTGWDKVYDWYLPQFPNMSPLPAPFLNSNHLAGALGLAAAVSIGLAFDEKDRYKRFSLIAAAGFTGGAVLLTLSRGGILCFAAGQILFIGLRVWQRLTESRKPGSGARAKRSGGRHEVAALPLVLGLGLASGAYVAMRAIVGEFASGDSSKFDIWIDALPMLRDYWLTGSGRGTFQVAYTAYQALPDTATFVYPENFLANWVGEWGAFAGGGLILALVASIVVGLIRPPSRARNAGSLAAVFALLVQNFADFGLELPGLLLPFLVCLGVETMRIEMSLDASMERIFRPLPGPLQRWIRLLGPALAVLVAALLMPAAIRREPRAEDAALEKYDYHQASDARFGKDLRAAMERHPADYHLPLLGGIRAYHTGRSNPLPMLGRSILLFPRGAVAHLYVARTLARAGRADQALVEYMESARSREALLPRIADEVVKLVGGFEQAKRLARLDPDRVPVYVALAAAYLRAGMQDEARRADVAALGIDPSAPEPLVRAVRRHMDASMWDEAGKLVRRLGTVPGYESRALALEGELLQRTGHPDKAVALYEAVLRKDPSQRGLLPSIAAIHGDAGREAEMFDALDRYQASAVTEADRGNAYALRGSMAMQLGLNAQALAAFQEASSSLPDDAGVWKAIAGLYEKSGDSVAALSAYRELARIEPDNQDWKKKIDALYMQAKTGIRPE